MAFCIERMLSLAPAYAESSSLQESLSRAGAGCLISVQQVQNQLFKVSALLGAQHQLQQI